VHPSCQTLGVVEPLGSEVNSSRSPVVAASGFELAALRALGRWFSIRSCFVLCAKLKEFKVSARAVARSRANVGQSVGPQPVRVGTVRSARKSLVSLQGELRLQWGMHQSLFLQGATPNRSIEGTFKRLRLLPAPHVKR
jgi:hypothetical protein